MIMLSLVRFANRAKPGKFRCMPAISVFSDVTSANTDLQSGGSASRIDVERDRHFWTLDLDIRIVHDVAPDQKRLSRRINTVSAMAWRVARR